MTTDRVAGRPPVRSARSDVDQAFTSGNLVQVASASPLQLLDPDVCACNRCQQCLIRDPGSDVFRANDELLFNPALRDPDRNDNLMAAGIDGRRRLEELLSEDRDPSRRSRRIQDTIGLADRLVDRVRDLSLDLRPPLLDELGQLVGIGSLMVGDAGRLDLLAHCPQAGGIGRGMHGVLRRAGQRIAHAPGDSW